MSHGTGERLIRLEEELAFQEQRFEGLNSALLLQQKQLDKLEAALLRMEERLNRAMSALDEATRGAPGAPDEKPPHYL